MYWYLDYHCDLVATRRTLCLKHQGKFLDKIDKIFEEADS